LGSAFNNVKLFDFGLVSLTRIIPSL